MCTAFFCVDEKMMRTGVNKQTLTVVLLPLGLELDARGQLDDEAHVQDERRRQQRVLARVVHHDRVPPAHQVAAQAVAHLKAKYLKPGHHISGSRVESPNQAPFKRYGSTEFNSCTAPYHEDLAGVLIHRALAVRHVGHVLDHHHGVGGTSCIRKQTSKPGYHFILPA
jgi:hypothetical protein